MAIDSKRSIWVLSGLGLLLLSLPALGNDQKMVFRNPYWAVLIPIFISVALVAVGCLGSRIGIPNRIRWVVLFLGAIAGVVVAPMVYMEQVTVSKTEIFQQTGLAFMPLTEGFRYDEVKMVRLTTTTTGRRQRTILIWEISYKDGNIDNFNPSDLWERNSDSIVPWLEEMGVLIVR